MKRFFSFLFVSVIFSCFTIFAQEGKMTAGGLSAEESARSSADWYTWKDYNISEYSGTVLTVSTQWGLLLKGFINKRADNTGYVKFITSQGDTIINFPIPAHDFSGKTPVIAKIFKSGTSDSLIYCFQKK